MHHIKYFGKGKTSFCVFTNYIHRTKINQQLAKVTLADKYCYFTNYSKEYKGRPTTIPTVPIHINF